MDQQIATILRENLPGISARDVQPLGDHTLLLALSDNQRIVLHWGAVAGEAAALLRLAGEIDLPVPALIAQGENGPAGQPWLLRSYLEGTPLTEALPTLDEQTCYAVGRQLGELLYRVHSLRCERYGALIGDDPLASRDDLAYLLRRSEAALAQAPLEPELAEEVRVWFGQQYIALGKPAVLMHGNLHPAHVLLRQRGARVRVSGLVGWQAAQGWLPAWDHVGLVDSAVGTEYFGLRVGYGDSYDSAAELFYAQVREYALLPYRLLRTIEMLPGASDDERQQQIRLLLALLNLSGQARDDEPDTALSA